MLVPVNDERAGELAEERRSVVERRGNGRVDVPVVIRRVQDGEGD